MIKLGQMVTDPITGFSGIAVSKTEWLYGCTRFGLQGKLNEDGTVPDLQWFDELQLESKPPDVKIGGPTATPRRAADPMRR